ncbi:MAG: hypothetical protein LBQ83_08365 [Candidatus Margulisbacteria bacterium]|nr:hypothetical protein [Candidatus Margulisiibacteriota bacterium]
MSLVGHTLRSTTLQDLQVGSKVNIEYDLLLRYIQNFLPAGKKTTLHRFW